MDECTFKNRNTTCAQTDAYYQLSELNNKSPTAHYVGFIENCT